VYEYAVIDRSHTQSLAGLRKPFRIGSRIIGDVTGVSNRFHCGFGRQYQVNLGGTPPTKLRAYNIPLSTVDRPCPDSTNEVAGRVLEMGGAQ